MIQHDAIIKADQIQNLIFTIRGVQVMIDGIWLQSMGLKTNVLMSR